MIETNIDKSRSLFFVFFNSFSLFFKKKEEEEEEKRKSRDAVGAHNGCLLSYGLAWPGSPLEKKNEKNKAKLLVGEASYLRAE